MKITKINRAYLPDTIMRDCETPLFVEFRESEIGLINQEKWIGDLLKSDAIVGIDPLLDRYVCLALDGKLAWSRGYKTIKAAIKNAVYA